MGCQSSVVLGDNLIFSICTHDPDTGELTDADGAPTYRVYEDETGTPILTGTLTVLDNANTTGFYTELIACTAGNGFEDGKSYTVYVEATVDGATGGICYGFTSVVALNDLSAAEVNAEVVDALNVDTYAEPGQGEPPATASIITRLGYLYKLLINRITQTDTTLSIYDNAGTTVDQKAIVSDDTVTYDRGKIGTGP